MSQVIKLKMVSLVCNNTSDVATDLRRLADKLDAGDYGEVRVTITVIDAGEDGIWRYSSGPAGLNKCEVIGLLTYGVHHARNDE